MSKNPNLKLPYIEPAQAQKHVTHNEALRYLDALIQLSVVNRDLSAPPTQPVEGNVSAPDTVWVTDITYIRTHEGWLYLAAVIDLYSRKVVGWSMSSRMQTSLALNALLMAVWRRKPTSKVIIHSDQGSQFTSHEWREFLTDHNLEASMSRRGNCYHSRHLLRNCLPCSGQCCGGELLPLAQNRTH